MRAVESSAVVREAPAPRPADLDAPAFDPARLAAQQLAASGLPRGRSGAGGDSAGGGESAPAPPISRAATLAEGSPGVGYPPALLYSGRAGEVLARFVVGPNGRAQARTLEVLHADHPLFAAAVREALPGMRFQPALAEGRKVPQQITLPFRFSVKRR